MSMNLKDIIKEQKEWSDRNFGNQPAYFALLGAMEELGELSHAHLKEEQGIRGNEDHVENAQDAVADTVIYLIDYCNRRGWDFEEILINTWKEVSKRDWKTHNWKGVDQ